MMISKKTFVNKNIVAFLQINGYWQRQFFKNQRGLVSLMSFILKIVVVECIQRL